MKKISFKMCIMVIVFTAVFIHAEASSDDTLTNTLKQRVITELTYDFDDTKLGDAAKISKEKLISKAEQYVNTMNTDASDYVLWSNLPVSISGVNEAFSRLLTISKASRMNNNAWDENVKKAVTSLSYQYYNIGEDEGDDWWYYEIGIPKSLVQILIIEEGEFDKAEIENLCSVILSYCPSARIHTVDTRITETGANLAWKAEILVYCGLLLNNQEIITDALNACDDLFKTVKSGDGFYKDGSFIQHDKVPYIGSYGKNLLESIASMTYVVSGTNLDFDESEKEIIRRWIFDSFAPFMQNGAVMSMVRGRAIARYYETDQSAGRNIIEQCAKLSETIDSNNEIADFIKEHISVNDLQYVNYEPFTIQLLEGILSDTSKSDMKKDGAWLFPSSDRAVFLRNGIKMGISMSSSRIYAFESNGKENFHGWHTGSGMTYLYGNRADAYDRGFWCTVNPYRLSGTTVDDTEYKDGEGAYYLNGERWCGGAILEGKFAAVGMSLKQYNSNLTGKKSWFCIGDEFIAMGTDITNDSKAFTTVENKIINQDNTTVTLNGKKFEGNDEGVYKTYWFSIEEDGDSTGYYFPKTDYLRIKTEKRSGNWKDIHGASDLEKENTFFSAVKEHGSENDADYVYAILPGATADVTQKYAQDYAKQKPHFEVVANNKNVQAVKNTNVIAANFWSAGNADEVSADREAAVVVYDNDGIIKIAVSDPTQRAAGSIRITINKAAAGIDEKSDEITVISLSPKIVLDVDTSALQGRSVQISLLKSVSGSYNKIIDNIFFKPNMENGTIAQGEGSLNENTVTFSTKGSNKITYQLDEPMKVGAEETYLIEWDQYLGTDIDGTGELNGYNGQFLSMSNAVLGGGFKKNNQGVIKPFLWWYNTGEFSDITIENNTWYHMQIVAELHSERRDKLYLYVTKQGKTMSGIPVAKLEIEGNVEWKEISLFCRNESAAPAVFANLNITKTCGNIAEAFYLIDAGKTFQNNEAWNLAETVYSAFSDSNIKKIAQQIFGSSASEHFNETIVVHDGEYLIFNATDQIQEVSVITKTGADINIDNLTNEIDEVKKISKAKDRIFIWKSLNSMVPIKCFE